MLAVRRCARLRRNAATSLRQCRVGCELQLQEMRDDVLQEGFASTAIADPHALHLLGEQFPVDRLLRVPAGASAQTGRLIERPGVEILLLARASQLATGHHGTPRSGQRSLRIRKRRLVQRRQKWIARL